MSVAVSRFRAVLIALCATVLTAACAAGQQAQTADELPTLDGTQGRVGTMLLNGVALHTPTNSTAYAKGSDVLLKVYITNNGQQSDKLTSISSPSFSGDWSVVGVSSITGLPIRTGVKGPAQTIGAGSALGLGLQDLTASGAGSSKAVLMQGLTKALYPGSTVPITFTFAKAGATTLSVPVQLSSSPNTATLPSDSSSE